MSDFNHDLDYLANRAGQGDSHAAVELEQELKRQMDRIVRRAMRPTAGASPVTQRVRDAARRVGHDAGRLAADPDQLVSRITDDLCASVVGRFGAGRRDASPLRETIRA